MPKGYKKEYIDKVKNKFNDIQPNKQLSQKSSNITSNDKKCDVKHSKGMVRI